MRKFVAMFLFAAALLTANAAFAQNPNYTPGPVWRVNYYSIKTGQGDAFWKDVRENLKPVYDDFKKEGWLVDYKVWTNPTVEHPGDWDVAIGLLYANYAALDELDAKGATVVIKHFGSREAMMDAAKKRAELRDLIASHLAREVMLK